MKRLIVCGSRNWDDPKPIAWVIAGMCERLGPLTVVHGAARGADDLAGVVARKFGLLEEPHPADWRGQGKMAGPRRNRLMLDLGADYVVAFKDGFDHELARGGTENMIKIARVAGVPTLVVSH